VWARNECVASNVRFWSVAIIYLRFGVSRGGLGKTTYLGTLYMVERSHTVFSKGVQASDTIFIPNDRIPNLRIEMILIQSNEREPHIK
jgi:hypothetical protein